MRNQSDIQTILNSLRSQGAENEIVEFKEAKNQYDFNKYRVDLDSLKA
jgi:hypothetical protein